MISKTRTWGQLRTALKNHGSLFLEISEPTLLHKQWKWREPSPLELCNNCNVEHITVSFLRPDMPRTVSRSVVTWS